MVCQRVPPLVPLRISQLEVVTAFRSERVERQGIQGIHLIGDVTRDRKIRNGLPARSAIGSLADQPVGGRDGLLAPAGGDVGKSSNINVALRVGADGLKLAFEAAAAAVVV